MNAMEQTLASIAKEVRPNGGASLRDAVERTEKSVAILGGVMRAHHSADDTYARFEADGIGLYSWVNPTYLRWAERSMHETEGYGWINCIGLEDQVPRGRRHRDVRPVHLQAVLPDPVPLLAVAGAEDVGPAAHRGRAVIPLPLIGAGKAVKTALAAIPWPVYALAALLLAGWLYGNHRESVGEARVQAAWDAEKTEIAEAVAEAERLAREREAEMQAGFDAAVELLTLEKANALAELEKDLAALRADNASLRVRDRFRCPASGGVPSSAGDSGNAEEAGAGLLREDAEFLLRLGREADDVVRDLNTCIDLLETERLTPEN
jgi:hypothetical protein